MEDHQRTSQCQASLNPIIRINEKSDKGGVGEVDGEKCLDMYGENN